MHRVVAPALALIAACFSPDPPSGAPCAPDQRCPAPLACIAGTCRLPGAPTDGAPADGATAPDGSGPAPPDGPLVCPPGFGKASSGACLLDVLDPHSWLEAEQDCELRGGHLAVPVNPIEAKELQTPRWLGISDRVLTGTFRAVTGAVIAFTYWDTNEPSGGGQHCVHTGGPAAQWHTGPCDFPFPYTCEYDGLPVAPGAF